MKVPNDLKPLRDFLQKKQKLSSGTVKTVSLCLWRIKKVYGVKSLTPQDIRSLFNRLKQEGYSTNYVANYRHAIGKLAQFLNDEIEIPQVKKRRDFKPEFAAERLIEQLYTFPLRKGFKRSDRLWNLVIELMAKTGITREQVINLRVGDVDFNNKVIRVRYKRHFTIPLPEEMTVGLNDWIADKPPRSYLFSGNEGQLRPESVNKVFWRRLEKLGIDEKVSPRILRHTYLKNLVEKRLPLSELKRLAGDVNLRHLNRYFE